MFDFQQKNKLRKIFYSPVVVGIIVCIALYSIYSTFSIYRKMIKSRDDLEQSQKQLLALAEKNQQLDNQINGLQTQEGIEKEIRAKFGVAKPDESVAVIVNDSVATSSVQGVNVSFWQKLKKFFGF